ncbi:MAG: ABC transporter permease [Clostridiales bacterium]|nr:ABC transporter permease [Clostridiales bacterium]
MTQDQSSAYTQSVIRDFATRNKVQIGILIVFLLLWVVYLIGNWNVFSRFDIYRSFLTTIPFIGITALGATFIITLGDIDLSFPSVMAVTAWVFCKLISLNVNIWAAALVCLCVGALIGLFNATLITRIGIPAIVATIATQFLFRGVVNVLASGQGISLVSVSDSVFAKLAVSKIIDGKIPMQAIWFFVLAILFWFILNRHKYGSYVSFVGDNKESARMMGINVDMVRTIAFVIMGVLAALTGILSNLEVQYFWPNQGEGSLMPVLAAVFVGGTSVMGGRGTIFGTVLGVLMIGSLEASIIAIGLSGFWVQLIYGAVIIICVTIYTLISGRRKDL